MSELTVNDVLTIIHDRAQWCRENGESDMRNILSTIRALYRDIADGKSREEILAEWEDEEEDD